MTAAVLPGTARAPSRRVLLGLLAGFLLQAGLLGWMVVDRALLLARGAEIRLAVVPVDPRDLLRGDYVILSYPLSRLKAAELGGDDDIADEGPIYVALRPEGRTWTAVSLHARPPAEGLFLKGRVTNIRTESGCAGECRTYEVAYNLEKFFVPEGQGLALENLRNDQRLEADVAVDRSGRAALRRLLVDGVPRHEDTLF